MKLKENKYHHLKIKWKLYLFLEEELESNLNLKNNAMVKLLKGKFWIEVSESTIWRALQEHEYHYIGPKICQKKTWKEQQKRLDRCRRHLDKYWHNIFFTDETTVYADNPQVINGWRKMKSILNTNNKRREQKLNLWELFQQMEK